MPRQDEVRFAVGADATVDKLMEFSRAKGFVMLANEMAEIAKVLTIWVVYDHPSEYPEGFIARAHVSGAGWTGPSRCTIKAPSLDDLRRLLKAVGLSSIARDPGDDAKIVESWL